MAPVTLDFELQRDTFLAFTTPIAKMRVKEAETINSGLRSAILEKEGADDGQGRSAISGWRSQDELLTWPGDEVASLKESFQEAVNTMIAFTSRAQRFTGTMTLHGWASVCRRGDYLKPQSQPGYHWSGLYFVEPGTANPDNPHSGRLEFQDPRGSVDMIRMPGDPFGRPLSLAPEAGQILIFPSWLQYWANPYDGEGERVSVAFNARMSDFKVQE